MKAHTKTARRKIVERVAQVFWHGGMRPSPDKFTFVVSWMRTGSSLLSNLLLADRNVFGIGETHVRHERPSSLTEVVFVSALVRRQLPTQASQYLDKLLHNYLDERMPLEAIEGAKFVFLTRDIPASAASLARMWHRLPEGRYESPYSYLSERLVGLRRLAGRVPREHRFLIDLHDIVEDTHVFSEMGGFLGGSVPRSYEVLPFVGRKGVGDFSNQIKLGHIAKASTIASLDHPLSQWELDHLRDLRGALAGEF